MRATWGAAREEVVRFDAGGEQALVGVTEGGLGDGQGLLGPEVGRESLRPESRSRCRAPGGGGRGTSIGGQLPWRVDRFARGLPVGSVDGRVREEAQQLGGPVRPVVALSRSGRSSMNEVVTPPRRKSGSDMTSRRKGMFVVTPADAELGEGAPRPGYGLPEVAARARQLDEQGVEVPGDRPPAMPVAPSRRMPAPPGERYAAMRPVSGRKPLAGSSVVIRFWMAYPVTVTVSCRIPISSSVSPWAMPSAR